MCLRVMCWEIDSTCAPPVRCSFSILLQLARRCCVAQREECRRHFPNWRAVPIHFAPCSQPAGGRVCSRARGAAARAARGSGLSGGPLSAASRPRISLAQGAAGSLCFQPMPCAWAVVMCIRLGGAWTVRRALAPHVHVLVAHPAACAAAHNDRCQQPSPRMPLSYLYIDW